MKKIVCFFIAMMFSIPAFAYTSTIQVPLPVIEGNNNVNVTNVINTSSCAYVISNRTNYNYRKRHYKKDFKFRPRTSHMTVVCGGIYQN